MNKLQTSKSHLKQTISSQETYDFPEFLHELRKSIGVSRQVVADDLGIHYMKIVYLESGAFKQFPEVEIISKLARYFGAPENLMQKKALKFVAEGKGKGQKCLRRSNEGR